MLCEHESTPAEYKAGLDRAIEKAGWYCTRSNNHAAPSGDALPRPLGVSRGLLLIMRGTERAASRWTIPPCVGQFHPAWGNDRRRAR
jgi:hypothetical protein